MRIEQRTIKARDYRATQLTDTVMLYAHPKARYLVDVENRHCNCPSFRFNALKGRQTCKHLDDAVMFYLEGLSGIKPQDWDKEFEDAS